MRKTHNVYLADAEACCFVFAGARRFSRIRAARVMGFLAQPVSFSILFPFKTAQLRAYARKLLLLNLKALSQPDIHRIVLIANMPIEIDGEVTHLERQIH